MTATLATYRGSRPVAYLATANGTARATDGDLVERIRAHAAGHGWRFFPSGPGDLSGLRLTQAQRDVAAEEMWDDEDVKTGVLQKCFGVMPLSLSASPDDPSSQEDRDAADFARWALCERLDLPSVMWSLLHCLRNHVVCEPVWATRPGTAEPELEDRGRWKGKHALSAVKAKPKGSYTLKVDDYANVLGVTASDGAFIPTTRNGEPGVVHLSFLPHYESPWGTSDYDAAIRPWSFKVSAWRLRRLYQDRLVGPYIKGTMPGALDASGPNAEKAQRLLELLQAARSCGVLLVEPGTETELLDLAGSSDDQFSKGIQDAKAAILTNFLGSYLHTMEGAQDGDRRGSAQVSMSVSEGHQWYLRSRVELVLNQQLGRLLVRRNFATAGWPKLMLEVVNPAWAKSALEVGTMMKKAGRPTSAKQWHAVSGWAEPTDAEDTVEGDSAPPPPPGMLPGQRPPPGGPPADDTNPDAPPRGGRPKGGSKPDDGGGLAVTTPVTVNLTQPAPPPIIVNNHLPAAPVPPAPPPPANMTFVFPAQQPALTFHLPAPEVLTNVAGTTVVNEVKAAEQAAPPPREFDVVIERDAEGRPARLKRVPREDAGEGGE